MQKEPTRQRNPHAKNKPFGTLAPNRSKPAMYWENIGNEAVGEFVSKLCDNGLGLVLGRTSDGGALSITILDGDQRIKEYSASVEAFTAFSDWAIANVKD